MRKIFLSILFCVAFSAAGLAQPRQLQPQDTDDRPKIDVSAYVVVATLIPEEHRLGGVAEVHFKQLERKDYVVFDLDRRLRVSNASMGGKQISFRQFDLDSTVEFDMKDQQFAGEPVLHVEYSGIWAPEQDRKDPIFARVSEDSAFL